MTEILILSILLPILLGVCAWYLRLIAHTMKIDKYPPKVIVVMRNDFPIGVAFSNHGAETIKMEDKKRLGNDSAHYYKEHEFTVKENYE